MSVALRVLVSVVLLTIVLFLVDWQGVHGALSRAEWGWLGMAFLAFNCSTVFAAKRWHLIFGASGANQARLKIRAAVAATYISLWLSNFLPTAFGGDIARVLAARRAGAALPLALGSAVLDRYLGITTLAFLFLLVEASLAAMGERRPMLPVAGALAVGFGVLLVLVWAGSRLPLRRQWLRSRSVRLAARSTALLRDLGTSRRVIGQVLMTSVAATMLGVLAYWGAIRCMSTGVGLPIALTAAVLGILASALPVSLSGWGVREGTVALVLSEIGTLSTSDASLIAVLNGAVIAVTSLIGFAVSLFVGWSWRAGAPDNDVARFDSGRRDGA
jgi:uncharacterized membrane protein YbhN (UPF0104 family)